MNTPVSRTVKLMSVHNKSFPPSRWSGAEELIEQDDRHHGEHPRILCRENRADHRSYRLHGKGAAGEAAEVLSWRQSCLRDGPVQGWSESCSSCRRHDQLQAV